MFSTCICLNTVYLQYRTMQSTSCFSLMIMGGDSTVGCWQHLSHTIGQQESSKLNVYQITQGLVKMSNSQSAWRSPRIWVSHKFLDGAQATVLEPITPTDTKPATRGWNRVEPANCCFYNRWPPCGIVNEFKETSIQQTEGDSEKKLKYSYLHQTLLTFVFLLSINYW